MLSAARARGRNASLDAPVGRGATTAAEAHLATAAATVRDLAQMYSSAELGEPIPIPLAVWQAFPAAPPRAGECSVCLQGLDDGAPLKRLPCEGAHVFHERCLRQWFERQPTCPTCRFDCRPGQHRGRSRFSAGALPP
uniref:RING-type domain-containing protein n=1 Tax=Alexandrium monilatum TaxID=311494 RepID=A0A7S4PTF4_9DINO|mmetsp:Transcript_88014/g.262467  ORF Transcript_88014/g.262467 Transcript_88014/m.262467 type:complete len:138 (-) Transcript_88014:86-499(-)